MARVTIHVAGGDDPIKVNVSPEDAGFYDDLPFTSSNVLATEIEE